MGHMWALFYVIASSSLAPASPGAIFNLPNLESCEFTRQQMVAKLGIRKSACIEIDPKAGRSEATPVPPLPPPPLPVAPHPEDHDHGR